MFKLTQNLNYWIQYSISNCLDETIQKTKWVRFPAFIALGASSLMNLVGRTSSAVETAFTGAGIICLSPFSTNSSDSLQKGWKILKKSPCEGLKIFLFPLEIIIGTFIILSEPGFFVISLADETKIDFEHSKTNTIGSEKHKKDRSDAARMHKEKLLAYQNSIDNKS